VPASSLPETIGTSGLRLTARDLTRAITLHALKTTGTSSAWIDNVTAAMQHFGEHGHLAVTRAQAAATATSPHRVDFSTRVRNQRTAASAANSRPFGSASSTARTWSGSPARIPARP
jgi:hypothetical protein